VLLSSFEEVLFLDSDNMPIVDPKWAFDLPMYQKTGAVFWPDYCNMHATPKEAFHVFGLPIPPSWPDVPHNRSFIWTQTCNPEDPFEISAGLAIHFHQQ
jgi:hypothetical protein